VPVAAAGIGFDIVGALALARGLFVSPDQRARRLQAAGNTFAVFRVKEAKARADGVISGSLLVAGFVLQALAYAMIAGGFRGVSM
jgi:hypothetical protein